MRKNLESNIIIAVLTVALVYFIEYLYKRLKEIMHLKETNEWDVPLLVAESPRFILLFISILVMVYVVEVILRYFKNTYIDIFYVRAIEVFCLFFFVVIIILKS